MTFAKNNSIIYINLDFKLNGAKYIAKYITTFIRASTSTS